MVSLAAIRGWNVCVGVAGWHHVVWAYFVWGAMFRGAGGDVGVV